ncbi:MAG: ClpXP protease specificity-enhancing factor [Ectothiorhodospiraceae bacterium]|nr:ClpXP protease specificity-enhancing factor [Ectothiorhodospiraceae bacterium]
MTEESTTMSSSRPYLLRAVREWLVDNGLTPQLLVDAQRPGVEVPADSVQDGRIVLNIADRAVRGLVLGNDQIQFEARFGGRPFRVRVPLHAVVAILARENGVGMSFPLEEPPPEPPRPPSGTEDGTTSAEPGPSDRPRPTLKVVK